MDTTSTTPKPSNGSPEGALPPEVAKAAAGETLTAAEEKSALDFILGPTQALEYNVPVQIETPDGLKPSTFRLRQLDPDVIDRIDASNRSGEGPFSKLDVSTFNAELVAEACVHIEDPTGRKVDPKSDQFRGGVPSPGLAMKVRFKYQPGLLETLAERIRESAGFGVDRVGKAQRVLVEAGKASSSEAG